MGVTQPFAAYSTKLANNFRVTGRSTICTNQLALHRLSLIGLRPDHQGSSTASSQSRQRSDRAGTHRSFENVVANSAPVASSLQRHTPRWYMHSLIRHARPHVPNLCQLIGLRIAPLASFADLPLFFCEILCMSYAGLDRLRYVSD
jgi:hypothetical protein